MPQLSLYIDEPTLKEVRRAARKERISVSRWISRRIKTAAESDWPEGFFDLAGSITDETFQRPPQLPFSVDSKRETL
jgi:hypothetical protein